MERGEPTLEVQVHEGDDPRIARILELLDEAARPRPLREVLGVLCGELARIVDSEVVSVYVRDEDDDSLVMRANVGLSALAIDRLKLSVGEGITGFAAECMRPVTVGVAPSDVHFKPVPGLGEENFPVFLALPVVVGRRSEAVVVLQRAAGHNFDRSEVVLCTALSGAFAFALERANARAEESEESEDEPLRRRAHLTGYSRAAGVALGRAESLATFEGLAAIARARGLDSADADTERVDLLLDTLGRVSKELGKVLDALELPEWAHGQLSALLMAAEDQRLRGVIEELAARETNPVLALRDVARTYARMPYEVEGEADPSMTARSVETEALCQQVAARLLEERVPTSGSVVLLTDRLPAILVLAALSNRAVALVGSGSLPQDGVGMLLSQAGSLPVVAEVQGLFSWTHRGDRILVDGQRGLLRVNPSAATVAEFRRSR